VSPELAQQSIGARVLGGCASRMMTAPS
jgi:hypothetical protein